MVRVIQSEQNISLVYRDNFAVVVQFVSKISGKKRKRERVCMILISGMMSSQ